MKNTVFGILAHVDAGKTTLSEQLLLAGGAIREAGRVDKGTSYLDNYDIERTRGITVYSKQAQLTLSGWPFTLLDTPGHSDFSGEAERVLSVLDAAILVVSSGTGVNGHTVLLKKLIDRYNIPTILFVNKTDLPGYDREALLAEIRKKLGRQCIPAEDIESGTAAEDVAVLDEGLLEQYLETETLPEGAAEDLYNQALLVPVYFGAALKGEGVEALIQGLLRTEPGRQEAASAERGEEALKRLISGGNVATNADDVPFSARVFGISNADRRLTYMKVTGGRLKVRDEIPTGRADAASPGEGAEHAMEKVTELRVYSGEKYKSVQEALPGDVVAVCGLEHTFAGQGLGAEADALRPLVAPSMKVRVIPGDGVEDGAFRAAVAALSEEEPGLSATTEADGAVYIRIMGRLQEEIMQDLFQSRFGMPVTFGPERVVYAETVRGKVEGAGHYEPLRHYAEVHLTVEEGAPGSGIVIESACPTDVLDKTYQRQVIDALYGEARNGGLVGVLTGAPLTDIVITLVSGKSHVKHTEPGDFREAALRALRQAMMRAENVLLEPWLTFEFRLPSAFVGRALTDISAMGGTSSGPVLSSDGATTVLTGEVPAAAVGDYSAELRTYSGGDGEAAFEPAGYKPASRAVELIELANYDPDRDIAHPSGSVFCVHGAGDFVPWDEAAQHMHLPYTCKHTYTYSTDAWVRTDNQWIPASVSEGAETQDDGSGFSSGGGPERGAGRDLTAIMNGLGKSANQKDKPRGRDRDLQKVRKREDELARKRAQEARQMQKAEAQRLRGFGVDPSVSSALSSNAGKGSVSTGTSGQSAKISGFAAAAGRSDLLLVDGYNIIFAWPELRDLAASNVDAARGTLNDLLSNYAGYTGAETIVVYDAYLLENHATEILKYHNIHVVFTATAETADQYIEKTAIKRRKDSSITVATSDRVERVIVLSADARVMSAESFKSAVDAVNEEIRGKI